MNAQDTIVAISALFIGGMIWLRTRTQYTQRAARRGPLRLEPAGRIYFAAVLAALISGYFVAPLIGHVIWPEPGATPTLMRVVWCLAMYYVFILVHRLLTLRGKSVFSVADANATWD